MGNTNGDEKRHLIRTICIARAIALSNALLFSVQNELCMMEVVQFTSANARGEIRVESMKIFLTYRATLRDLRFQAHICIWTYRSTRYFEPIYGFSRVLLLLPKKLATFLEIQATDCDNNDRTFIIDLLLRLLTVYRDQVAALDAQHPQQPLDFRLPNSEVDWTRHVIRFPDVYPNDSVGIDVWRFFGRLGRQFNLSQSVGFLMSNLAGIRRVQNFIYVRRQRWTWCKKECRKLVRSADCMLNACHAALDFAHPVWVDTNRTLSFVNATNESHVDVRRRAFFTRHRLFNRLTNEFDQLVVEYNAT